MNLNKYSNKSTGQQLLLENLLQVHSQGVSQTEDNGNLAQGQAQKIEFDISFPRFDTFNLVKYVYFMQWRSLHQSYFNCLFALVEHIVAGLKCVNSGKSTTLPLQT